MIKLFLSKTGFTIFFFLTVITNLSAQMTIKKLDSLALFSFSVISDNKGSSLENEDMYKCDKWIREAGDRFILGVGDHVKDNRSNHFLSLIKNDSLWHNHFYPNVADGENEFWGKNQADWGAGFPILDSVNLANRKNVIIRKNKNEYYAIEAHNGIKIHIIQLHFSDSPDNPLIAFNKSSRKYLMKILRKIHKNKNDIIIVLAHTGAWYEQLSNKQQERLFKKADLLLGATTHRYKRYNIANNDKYLVPIALNTGAIANSSESGFLQVHILKNPLRMVIQYQKTKNSSRQLQGKGFAYEKIINGKIKEINWNTYLSN